MYTSDSYGGPFASGGRGGYDPESQIDYSLDSKINRQIRHAFIRKVYGILLSQLVATFLVTLLFMTNRTLASFVQAHSIFTSILTSIGALCILCYLAFKPGASQSYPSNYILLSIFTIFESVSVALLCSFYHQIIVLQALLATSVIVLGLTLFAFQTKYDFTSWMGFMFFVMLGFMTFALMTLFFPKNRILDIVYSSVGALIFSIYLVIDTQLMIGEHKHRLEADDYILAALMLYMDIVNIFIYMLRIFSAWGRGD